MQILHKAELRLGREIAKQEISQGHLKDLLIKEDYLAPVQVKNLLLDIVF